ncbi:MAG: HAD family hydrolase [Bacteroidota bacterium]
MRSNVAFIFDMDGVIVDSNPFHKIALKQFCKQHGFDLSEEQLREKIYGRTNKDWIANVFGKIEPSLVKQYGEEKEALFREIYKNEIRPIDGLVDFLRRLDEQQIPRAIATSAPKANVDFTLKATRMARFFPLILDESFVTRGKPDPEIYLKTVAALGLKPDQCIVLEDSLSGVRAGKAAGCKVVGITTTHTREELHETDLIIDNFNELDPQTLITGLFK